MEEAGDTAGDEYETGATGEELLLGVSVAVTGQTVVETATRLVTTTVEDAGQLVTVGAQDVIVSSDVL